MEKLTHILLAAVFEAPQGTSWKDLDRLMRVRIKRVLYAATTVFLLLTLLAVYLLFLAPELEFPADILTAAQTFISGGSALTKGLGGLVLAVVLYLYGRVVVDLGRAHYRLDKRTFKLLSAVNDQIAESTKEATGCADVDGCSLDAFRSQANGQRRLIREVFYKYANRDNIGDWDQAEKRRDVFDKWAEYYMSNILMFILAVFVITAGCVAVIGEVTTGWWNVLWLIAIGGVGRWWVTVGDRFRPILLELAEEQVRAFHRHTQSDFSDDVRTLIGGCSERECNL